MFTGIIQCIGKVLEWELGADEGKLKACWSAQALGTRIPELGDSIAVNGVCLTVTDCSSSDFSADISAETLARTTLGALSVGDQVNLEAALLASSPLGGHLVSGHIDGTGQVLDISPQGQSRVFRLQIPRELMSYIATKGSVAVDGVSLTVNRVETDCFEVNIIPHTAQNTLFGIYRPGSRVNIEVDLIARYTERLLIFQRESPLP